MVQETSRRFMELLSVVVPGMKMMSTPKAEGNGHVKSLVFKYAYDKNLGICVSTQKVAEGTKVENCPDEGNVVEIYNH